MSKILFEACVDSIQDADKAFNNGAHRLELCSRLDLDGLTPEAKLIDHCLNNIDLPAKVMVRPRKGGFEYDLSEQSYILETIQNFASKGIHDIVVGATKGNRLYIDFIKEIGESFPDVKLTIHKAIDQSSNIIEDIQLLKNIPNVVAILSSGGQGKAVDNIEMLKAMHRTCTPEIQLVIAGKVTQSNFNRLLHATGCNEYHGKRIMEKD